jgi:hypothetical protein
MQMIARETREWTRKFRDNKGRKWIEVSASSPAGLLLQPELIHALSLATRKNVPACKLFLSGFLLLTGGKTGKLDSFVSLSLPRFGVVLHGKNRDLLLAGAISPKQTS